MELVDIIVGHHKCFNVTPMLAWVMILALETYFDSHMLCKSIDCMGYHEAMWIDWDWWQHNLVQSTPCANLRCISMRGRTSNSCFFSILTSMEWKPLMLLKLELTYNPRQAHKHEPPNVNWILFMLFETSPTACSRVVLTEFRLTKHE